MKSNEYIDSGILEQYVLGLLSSEESIEVEFRAANDISIQNEIDAICDSLEQSAFSNAIEPNPIVKPFLLATIDFTERLRNGEQLEYPPLLHKQSSVSDYSSWLQRNDMVLQSKDDIVAKIIGFSPEVITAVVWIKKYAPQEVHENEYERFLIVEGTCDIIVGDEINSLVAGDYFEIPLHKNHLVKVTSMIPCKVILQRVAA